MFVQHTRTSLFPLASLVRPTRFTAILEAELLDRMNNRKATAAMHPQATIFRSRILRRLCITLRVSDRKTDMSKPETQRQNPTAQPSSLQADCSATDDLLVYAFLQGAKWWEYKSHGATMWNDDQQTAVAYAQALLRDRKLGRQELPNVPAQRPRASDDRLATQTQTRGSLQPVC